MTHTELRYYNDSSLLECQSTILQVRPFQEGHEPGSKVVDLILDATIFYPEGGGQPSDRGTIQGFSVVEVKKQEGVVVHRVLVAMDMNRDLDQVFFPGQVVDCRVDGSWRRDYQQQHTGQHILSASLLAFGNHETVSIHLGEENLMIETNKPHLSPGEIEQIQGMANRIIEEHVPITTTWVTEDQLDQYALRRKPQVSGQIRLVMIGDYDCVACGGIHVKRTGQVRLIQYLGQESIRGRIRSHWKVGDRALADYALKTQITQRLGEEFSAPLANLEPAVGSKLEELQQLQKRYDQSLRSRAELMAQQILREQVPHLRLNDDTSQSIQSNRSEPFLIVKIFEQEEKELIRRIALELSQVPWALGLLFNHGITNPHSKTQEVSWILIAGKETGFDFGRIKERFFDLIDAKGGGKPPIWQGVGQKPSGIEDCIQMVQDSVDF